jgi:hypothetical protein
MRKLLIMHEIKFLTYLFNYLIMRIWLSNGKDAM